MSDRKTHPGKFVWFEHVSRDARKAQAFYGEVLGWKVAAYPMGATHYEMIQAGAAPEDMVGGYPQTTSERPAHWLAYASVDDVDAAVRVATASGGRVVEAPSDIPQVGRKARIADPQGAELALLHASGGDADDRETAPHGHFFWNELHTTDPAAALAFYGKVLGYTSQAMGAGAETYHVLLRDGVGRGGVTGMLPPGVPPHWLPYVHVDDVDATVARARRLGAPVPVPPTDIPDIGRFAVLGDPTGATLAVMKPRPMPKK